MNDLSDFFDQVDDLGIFPIVVRSLMVFFATLILLRIAGRRSFGQKTAFDLCITVLLGAVLSRAIVGATPVISAVVAGACLVVAHRVLGILAARWKILDRWINGTERILIDNGKKDDAQFRAALVTDSDVEEALRKKLGNASAEEILQAILERNGEITIIPRVR